MPPTTNKIAGVKAIASNARLEVLRPDFTLHHDRVFEGDVVLVEALADEGAYAEIETLTGRSETLWTGDRFVAVAGNRQSSSYLYGSIPPDGIDLNDGPALHLLSNGGIIGQAAVGSSVAKFPLAVHCHGVLADEWGPINTIRRHKPHEVTSVPPLVLVAASATDAGKTTMCARLIATLTRSHGLRVGGVKLAGTGCLEDVLVHRDAGAAFIRDFPDVGLPSTYTTATTYQPAIESLLYELADHRPDLVVAELGGDLIWGNIPTLLQMDMIRAAALGLVMIPGDALSAHGAQQLFQSWGMTVPITWATPWNRNHLSLAARLEGLVDGPVIDSRNRLQLQHLAADYASRAAHS